jgi:hypothetical protein
MFKLSIVFISSNRGFLKEMAFILTYQGFRSIEVSLYWKLYEIPPKRSNIG